MKLKGWLSAMSCGYDLGWVLEPAHENVPCCSQYGYRAQAP